MLLNYYILILSKNTNITEGSYWEFRGLQYRSKWPTLNQQEEILMKTRWPAVEISSDKEYQTQNFAD